MLRVALETKNLAIAKGNTNLTKEDKFFRENYEPLDRELNTKKHDMKKHSKKNNEARIKEVVRKNIINVIKNLQKEDVYFVNKRAIIARAGAGMLQHEILRELVNENIVQKDGNNFSII